MPLTATAILPEITRKLQLSAAAPAGDKPVITAGGVVSASAFNAKAGVAPGSWLEIFGSNLATSTRTWQSSDFNGNNASLSLDGVSVTVDGKRLTWILSVPAK